MRETFELMLRTAEIEAPESLVWPYAALQRLPEEAVASLKQMGLVTEIEPAAGLTCTECDEACWAEPRAGADPWETPPPDAADDEELWDGAGGEGAEIASATAEKHPIGVAAQVAMEKGVSRDDDPRKG